MTNEEIVAALAALDPENHNCGRLGCFTECFFCEKSKWDVVLEDPREHEPDCLWRIAKERVGFRRKYGE